LTVESVLLNYFRPPKITPKSIGLMAIQETSKGFLERLETDELFDRLLEAIRSHNSVGSLAIPEIKALAQSTQDQIYFILSGAFRIARGSSDPKNKHEFPN
jgi:hypothetical protein